jgi:hypothetical protein
VTTSYGLVVEPEASVASLVSYAPIVTRTYTIVRMARDRSGNPVVGADVYLFDATTKALEGTTVTGSDGTFRFPGHGTETHFAVLFFGSSPRRAGVTADTLVGTE